MDNYKKTTTLVCIQHKDLNVFVIVECEFDYNSLDSMYVIGPYDDMESATKDFIRLHESKNNYINYYIHEVNKMYGV
jgi:hypothetical protein